MRKKKGPLFFLLQIPRFTEQRAHSGFAATEWTPGLNQQAKGQSREEENRALRTAERTHQDLPPPPTLPLPPALQAPWQPRGERTRPLLGAWRRSRREEGSGLRVHSTTPLRPGAVDPVLQTASQSKEGGRRLFPRTAPLRPSESETERGAREGRWLRLFVRRRRRGQVATPCP